MKECLTTSEGESISPPSLHIGLILLDAKSLSMTELAAELRVKLPTISTFVDSLVEQKLAERTNDSKDRRIVKIHLTKHGTQRMKKLKLTEQIVTKQMLKALSVKELKQLNSLIHKII